MRAHAGASKRIFIAAGLAPSLLIYAVFVIVPIFWSAYYGFLIGKESARCASPASPTSSRRCEIRYSGSRSATTWLL